MNGFDAVILGMVEGITEFLPISSTGHMIMAANLLGLASDDFLKEFETVIQMGAILAVIALYFRSFLNVELLKKLFIAFIPTGIIGFTIYPFFKSYLSGNIYIVIGSLIVGGIALIVFELTKRSSEKGIETLSYKDCVIIGLCQSVAIIPGVSRSAATIVGGELLGMSRAAIVEFSFLLAVPTMTAASGYDLLKSAHVLTQSNLLHLAIGFITAFVVAYVVISLFLAYIRNHTFVSFGIYRIVVAGAMWLLVR